MQPNAKYIIIAPKRNGFSRKIQYYIIIYYKAF